MVSAEVKALLAAAEETEERYRRYSRVADMLDRLTLPLYIPASAVTVAGLVAYLLYGIQHVAAIGLALWIVNYARLILYVVSGYMAVKAARRACVFRRTAEVVAEIDRIMAKLEKEIDELEQELKKRGIARETSAE